MAWDALPQGGYVGEGAVDVLCDALHAAADEYQTRFGRLPYLHELFATIERVLGAQPHEFVEDPQHWAAARLTAPVPIGAEFDPDDYDASWAEEPDPSGTYFVRRLSDGRDILRCLLTLHDRRLEVRYEPLGPPADDATCRRLIAATVLRNLAADEYRDRADVVVYRRIGTSEDGAITPYPS